MRVLSGMLCAVETAMPMALGFNVFQMLVAAGLFFALGNLLIPFVRRVHYEDQLALARAGIALDNEVR